MRQITKILAMALVAVLFAGSAWALPTLGVGENKLTLSAYEQLVSPGDDGNPTVGSKFIGFAQVSKIELGSSEYWLQDQTDRLLAYFALEIINITSDYDGEGNALFTFGATNDDPNDILNGDEVMKFVTTSYGLGTWGANESNFNNLLTAFGAGTDWMTFALNDNQNQDTYWYSVVDPTFTDEPTDTTLGNTWFSLNYTYKANGIPEIIKSEALWAGGDGISHFSGTGEVKNLKDLFLQFEINGSGIMVATPEPGTLLLLGAGLLGLGAVARRRKN